MYPRGTQIIDVYCDLLFGHDILLKKFKGI